MEKDQKYDVYFYTTSSGRKILLKFILSLDPISQSRVWNSIKLLREHGLHLLTDSQVKKVNIRPALFELRIIGTTHVRFLFVQYSQSSFLILYGFIKKVNKLPDKHKKLAITRSKEFV